jgi:hypothetical protein
VVVLTMLLVGARLYLALKRRGHSTRSRRARGRS